MDIEGAERDAVKGMSSLLSRNRKVKIVTEFNPPVINACGLKPEALPTMLLAHSFKLHNINEQEKKIEPVNIDELLQQYTAEKNNYTNLLCTR